MERKIITTNDGSKTIFLPAWNENYHSKHGALQEAMHVFIQSGFEQHVKNPIRILEIGYGSGLNTILTYIAALDADRSVNYIGLEAFPISDEEQSALAYHELEIIKEQQVIFDKMHQAVWNKAEIISPSFSLLKLNQTLDQFAPNQACLDLIYFDAFGPRVQPEMWHKIQLQKMYDALDIEGVFVTYCAKGQVRRDLEAVGFTVEKIPGPPGKREMLRATKY